MSYQRTPESIKPRTWLERMIVSKKALNTQLSALLDSMAKDSSHKDNEGVFTLIKEGADIETPSTSGGLTPLILFSAKGCLPEVERLIELGADINSRSFAGETPLMVASYHANPDIVQSLLDTNADIYAVSRVGLTVTDMVYSRLRNAMSSHLLSCKEKIESFEQVISHLEAFLEKKEMESSDERVDPVLAVFGLRN